MGAVDTNIGFIISVSGSKVTGILVSPDAPAGENGEVAGADGVQIGALVKVRTPRSITFGVVSALEIREPSSPPKLTDPRIAEIDLFGEAVDLGDNGTDFLFQRGVSIYPSLGQSIYVTTSVDLARIYACPKSSNVRIGTLHQDSSLPAYALTDDLLGKHMSILGTTGSGKSCSVALILRSVLAAHPNGHVVLLDPHSEYASAFEDMAEIASPETLQLPYWLLNSEEVVEVWCTSEGPARDTEAAILKEAILAAKRAYFTGESEDTDFLTVDTPVPYRLGTLLQIIDEAMGQLDKPENSAPYLRVKGRIEALRADRRFGFMFSGLSVRDNMGEVLSRILRMPVGGKPITVVDLSGVPSEIIDVVVSMMCRLIFDFALWSDRAESIPVLVVCEEAHRYIPRDPDLGFKPTRKAISRIAKEGRKYGVSLCLVSQRPSELSETILSQCNTLFALRMSNVKDQEFVQRALPDSAAGLLNSLPALRTQEAVVVGEGVTLPMRIRFDDLTEDQLPRSATARFSTAWAEDRDSGALVATTVERWRRQIR